MEVGGWRMDGGGLASPAWAKRVVCMACLSLFRASAQAREIPLLGRLHPAGKWAKPGTSLTAIGLARGAKVWEDQRQIPGCQMCAKGWVQEC